MRESQQRKRSESGSKLGRQWRAELDKRQSKRTNFGNKINKYQECDKQLDKYN